MSARTSAPAPPAPGQLLMERIEAATRGMGLSITAKYFPDRVALISEQGDFTDSERLRERRLTNVTFGRLNARANQLASALRKLGLKEEDALGLVCANRPEFAEAIYAGQRSGLRTVPINWHLTGEEIAYILKDSEAKAIVSDARFAEAAAEAARLVPDVKVRLAIGGDIAGFDSFEDAIRAEDDSDLEDAVLGRHMLYTSGTTGRPKGVYRPGGMQGAAQMLQIYGPILERYAFGEGDVNLVTGPFYHSAPLAFSLIVPMMAGITSIVMDGWEPEETLRLIEKHRVTHTHMVPIMFHRLMSLPGDVRARYDTSSLRFIVHGAAPVSIPLKKAMIDWLGPVVHEYYAATEGLGTFVFAEEWLERPGTVGKIEDEKVEVRGEDGKPLPPGEVGYIYIRSEEDLKFEYYKDPETTQKTYTGDHFTLGDMGYVDEDGYLFLADRSADLIISGGVNIYPAEVDAILLQHRAVADVATVGIPNDEWGEEVRAVVQLKPAFAGDARLESELLDHCRANLAHFKCPRAVDFIDELPRHDTGKIYRRLVREPYWKDHAKRI